jgi:hypothetical protein
MFDEPEETSEERVLDPAARAKEKADEFRMHAELFAVYEGPRKFAAALVPGLDAELARELQRGMAKLEKAKSAESPVLPPESSADAEALLGLATARGLSTGDYHIHRRPGEVMIARWLEGVEVETFYERMQAHVDAALGGYREDERQAHGWKNDPATSKYLDALDAVEVKAAERYLREIIKAHSVFVLSTVTADEMDILHLCDHIMGVPAAEVVGRASAPPEDGPTEQDRAWFFKLFSLRGAPGGVERMYFFTYLQKADDAF